MKLLFILDATISTLYYLLNEQKKIFIMRHLKLQVAATLRSIDIPVRFLILQAFVVAFTILLIVK